MFVVSARNINRERSQHKAQAHANHHITQKVSIVETPSIIVHQEWPCWPHLCVKPQ